MPERNEREAAHMIGGGMDHHDAELRRWFEALDDTDAAYAPTQFQSDDKWARAKTWAVAVVELCLLLALVVLMVRMAVG